MIQTILENLQDASRIFVCGSYCENFFDEKYMIRAEIHGQNIQSRSEQNNIIATIRNYNPHNILDIGCNTGVVLNYFCKELAAEGTGVDVNDLALQKAKQCFLSYNWMLIKNGESLPFNDISFDHIILHHVIGHVSDPLQLLSEIYRILRPGGTVSIITPNAYYKLLQAGFNLIDGYRVDKTVLRYYTMSKIQRLLKRFGFVIIMNEYAGDKSYFCSSVKTHLNVVAQRLWR